MAMFNSKLLNYQRVGVPTMSPSPQCWIPWCFTNRMGSPSYGPWFVKPIKPSTSSWYTINIHKPELIQPCINQLNAIDWEPLFWRNMACFFYRFFQHPVVIPPGMPWANFILAKHPSTASLYNCRKNHLLHETFTYSRCHASMLAS